MGNQFNSLTLVGVCNTDAAPFAHSTMTDSVISAVFQGDLAAQAFGAAAASQHAWAFRVVDIVLPLPTRRRFVVEAGISVQALNGYALARITVDGQTTSRQIRATTDPKAFNAQLRLPIRRTTYVRDRLHVLIWVEATSLISGGEAQAVADTLDVRAN